MSVGSFLFFHFGRSVWAPLLVRLHGKKTVARAVDEILARRPELRGMLAGRPEELAILIFKNERLLELWADGREIRAFPLTAFSGTLGPKKEKGDGQIPEGVYRPVFLHPNSAYHLSIKLGYPNEFDRARAAADKRGDLGGDIFIHGKKASIGCAAIGDDAIEEVFYAVSLAGLENTSVIISPYDMRRGRKPDLENTGTPWTADLYDEINRALSAF